MLDYRNADRETRLAIATADRTSTDVLKQLATDEDAEVRQAVASNPNTPQNVLLKLGKEFPDAVVANPIFNILLLENPENKFVRLSLARSSTASVKTLANLAQLPDEEVLCAIAQNSNTPISILEQLVQHPPQIYDYDDPDGTEFDRLFACVAGNPNTPTSLLIQLAKHSSGSVQYAIAENPNTPAEILNRFADWRNVTMQRAIVRNPNAPTAVLEKLAGEESEEIRNLVKAHPNASEMAIDIINFVEGKPGTSVELLEKLADDRRERIRLLVAKHDSTPDEILAKFIGSSKPELLRAITFNPNISSTTLEALVAMVENSNNRREFLTAGVFDLLPQHPQITAAALDKLVDLIPDRKPHIAQNPKVLESTLIRLVGTCDQLDREPELLASVCNNPNTPPYLLETILLNIDKIRHHWHIAKSVLKHSQMPVHFLERFAVDSRKYLRAVVAANCNTPVHILEQLAVDSESEVRAALAANANAPTSLLEKLAQDESVEVRAQLAGNSSIPIYLLEQILRDNRKSNEICGRLAQNPSTPLALLTELIQDPNPLFRFEIAMRQDTASLMLDRILDISLHQLTSSDIQSSSADWRVLDLVLRAVGSNRNTSTASLEKLVQRAIMQINLIIDRKSILDQAVSTEQEKGKSATHDSAFVSPIKDTTKLDMTQAHLFCISVIGALMNNPNKPAALLEELTTKLQQLFLR